MLNIPIMKINSSKEALPRRIINKVNWLFWQNFDLLYKLYIRYRANKIRKKDQIKVLFILAELSAWKTESLYRTMLNHPRFSPILGITTSIEVPGSKKQLIAYINTRGYEFVDLDSSKRAINQIGPDILFYYKPYDGSYPSEHIFKRHLSALCCFVNYAFTTMRNTQYVSFQICNYSWFVFAENQMVAQCKRAHLGWRANNVRVTGIPMQDQLILPQASYPDPWIGLRDKKRIIYAPHHTLKGTNGSGTEYATFLDFGEFMLELANKYRDKIQFAFKPHPTLYPKLLKIWGKARTDAYYAAWTDGPNTQHVQGEYVGLFMHSDAMIHDCGSFQVEYLYTKKPVMFIDAADYTVADQNEFGRQAHQMHYIGHSKDDIEQFILNVISEIDPMKVLRDRFYAEQLLPPHGKTASENIISTILTD